MPPEKKELEPKKSTPVSNSQKVKRIIKDPKGTIKKLDMSTISEGKEEQSRESLDQSLEAPVNPLAAAGEVIQPSKKEGDEIDPEISDDEIEVAAEEFYYKFDDAVPKP